MDWNTITNMLAGGGMGQAASGADPSTMPWYQDANLMSTILGQGAQAVTAGDPTSWQHQIGGLGAGMGQGNKMAMAMKKARGMENDRWKQLMALISGGPTPKDKEGINTMTFGDGTFKLDANLPKSEGDMGSGLDFEMGPLMDKTPKELGRGNGGLNYSDFMRGALNF
uniref:Uncharacterized protein n=1 Tax=viral metagenome TaxID=1070528 RepID=A0A6M3JCA3_9ZZZZ